ncbi:MAG: lasso RiPP family leader peptide-containing protein [Chloroflexi bacterium]|nr:lasso RiPP family leader peptide-containing protein [Chloroflexota bacterium]
MMGDRSDTKQVESRHDNRRRSYSPPQIVEYGTLQELTEGGAAGATDAALGKS